MPSTKYAQLNNEAVALLLAGENQKAVDRLSLALASIRRVVGAARYNIAKPHRSCACHDSFPLPHFVDQHCYIYSQAISFDLAMLPRSMDKVAQVSTAVIMFNLAITHHRVGLLTRNQSCLNRSIALYNLLLKLVRHSDFEGTAGTIKLASLNNLSQLRYQQGNFALATRGLEHLQVGLKQVTQNGNHQFTDDELHGLLGNVYFLKTTNVAPAA